MGFKNFVEYSCGHPRVVNDAQVTYTCPGCVRMRTL